MTTAAAPGEAFDAFEEAGGEHDAAADAEFFGPITDGLVAPILDGDYSRLARLRPIVAERRQLLVAQGSKLIENGFPLLPTLDAPHWTVTLAAPTTEQFARVRTHFQGPIPNAAYAQHRHRYDDRGGHDPLRPVV